MSEADIMRIIGARDDEHVIDAARRVVRERDEAVARNAKTYCAYCGEQFPVDGERAADAVGAHIAACKKHPMRAIEARLKESLAEVARLRAEAIDLRNAVTRHYTEAQDAQHAFEVLEDAMAKGMKPDREDRRWEAAVAAMQGLCADTEATGHLRDMDAKSIAGFAVKVSGTLLAEFDRAREPEAVLSHDGSSLVCRGCPHDKPTPPAEPKPAIPLDATTGDPAEPRVAKPAEPEWLTELEDAWFNLCRDSTEAEWKRMSAAITAARSMFTSGA